MLFRSVWGFDCHTRRTLELALQGLLFVEGQGVPPEVGTIVAAGASGSISQLRFTGLGGAPTPELKTDEKWEVVQ